MQAVIKAIGSQAFSGSEQMVILFGETATDTLKEYSVVQRFSEKTTLQSAVGDQIKIDEQSYTIAHIGPYALNNLNSIAHCTLVFDAFPESDPIMNGIYLEPHKLPQIKVGSIIDYQAHGASEHGA